MPLNDSAGISECEHARQGMVIYKKAELYCRVSLLVNIETSIAIKGVTALAVDYDVFLMFFPLFYCLECNYVCMCVHAQLVS